ncbi:pentatricopeptide repeat-containing protein At4g32450, mitochondrial [Ricinus communis]|uniref:pentatricopeptide repeat-containing protein At4g32450, mitochondrial n=1 Tax=Ricinus communis TaxID=3988 RepID=UPI00201A3BB3|nr:pentatricopeptide repeat-containing protein At4g32450, mitochondrial [Ricinus communis]
MSKRRLPLLTFNSITALSTKVCSSSNSSISFRTKYLSTAAQRSDLFNSVGNHLDNPDDHFQNPVNFDGNVLNPNWGFRETTGNVIGSNNNHNYNNNQVSQIGNSQNSGGYQNFSGSYRESWNNNYTQHVNQLPPPYYAGNVGMYPPSYGAAAQYQQNLSVVNAGQYMSNSNDVQNVMVASGVSNNPKVEDDLAESSSYRGTLEELDELCKEKKVKEAVEVLNLLEERRVLVDLPRFLQLMRICGEAKASEEAKVVHDHLVRLQSPLAVSTFNKILEMYGKCGDMDSAFAVFNKMPKRNLTTWDTMIAWLAKNGLGEDAIDLFSQFKQAGLVPDAQLFIGVFSACGVVGDVIEGMLHFESMKKDYGIVPSMEHFVSIVDMLGTIGHLDEALEFIEKMPMEPSIDVWESLMNLSRIHGNLELGDRCAKLVELLDASHLNEQSKAGLVPAKVSNLTKEKDKKPASQNLLEVRSRVHEYRAGDTSHPETDRIYAMLRGLRAQMKEHGYIPETRFVLHDVDQECKEDALLSHSERLAAAYGLLTSPARSPIRVIKNLRVCGDCHNALKIISKIVGRELIMRDAKRFHHFKDGVCSCRDYW